MTPQLALQAAAIFAAVLLLVRAGTPAERRALLVSATVLVLLLPLSGLAPTWSPPSPIADAAALVSVGSLQEPAGVGAPTAARASPGVDLLAWAWLLGGLVTGGRLVADLREAARLRRSARDRQGDVAISDAVDGPVVVGALDPVVLLPAAASAWSAPRRAHVLAHERAHVQGRDNLWLLLARITTCIHWFNPLAWWASHALRDACEQRADEAALGAGADPVDYAQTLVDLARRGPAAALGMARPSGLERRVRALLGRRRVGRPVRAAVGGVLLTLVAVGAATAAPTRPGAAGVDRALAAAASRLEAAYHPEAVALLVLDAHTGAVLGQLDHGGLLDRPVSPGSVLKPFTVAAAIEGGVPLDASFTDGLMGDVLACSSNTGAIEIGTRVGRPAIESVYDRVGLTVPAGISLDQLVLGDGLMVSPRQVARAWVALTGTGGISPTVASTVRSMLVGVTEAPQGTAHAAAIVGIHVAGKTGTAPLVLANGSVASDRYLSSFLGLVPAEDPEILVLVSVAGPQTDQAWGGIVAAPAFQEIVTAIRR